MKKIYKYLLEKILKLFLNTFFKSKFKNMNNSLFTNIAGILLALGALFTIVSNCILGECDFNNIFTAIMELIAAFGFLKARDHNVSSEDAGLK